MGIVCACCVTQPKRFFFRLQEHVREIFHCKENLRQTVCWYVLLHLNCCIMKFYFTVIRSSCHICFIFSRHVSSCYFVVVAVVIVVVIVVVVVDVDVDLCFLFIHNLYRNLLQEIATNETLCTGKSSHSMGYDIAIV